VSLPDLQRGGIAVACVTVTAGFLAADVGADFEPRSAIYHTPEEAEAQALTQIALYEAWAKQGRVRLLKSVYDLDHHLQLWQQDRTPGLVMLMEGADPIVHVRDLPRWWQRGLRMIGLTFGDTTYGTGVAGGSATFKQGGLTSDGVALLGRMAELGFIWDISHLAEEGIWQGLDLKFPRVCASHTNAQALTPTDRHLSDDVIRAVAQRNGVIGLVLYNGFLEPRWKHDRSIGPGCPSRLYVLMRIVLASQALTIDAALKWLPRDPQAAAQLLTELKAQSQEAIADIRRIVYDLRPPALDDLGLVNALREQAAHYAASDLQITVDAPDCLPALPAAVEVAAYRIVQEALTNVVRHAQARACVVRLRVDDALHIQVCDDGRGVSSSGEIQVPDLGLEFAYML
jgi:microsomal dipeptidase-like Zn-dependent dipeptidase